MKTFYHLFLASILCSFLAGMFVNALSFAAQIFQTYGNYLLWLTPLAGMALYYFGQIKYFKSCENENSPALTPYMYLAATWSHLFGASVGREGAAVQIGASTAEYFRRKFRHEESHRQIFAHSGVAAAFCLALGTPLASVAFAMEYKNHFNRNNFLASAIGAFVGWGMLYLLPVHHWQAPLANFEFSQILQFGTLGLYLLLWLLAQSFVQSEQLYSRIFSWIPKWITLPASGVLLGLLTMLVGNFQFNNFGTHMLDESFATPTSLYNAIGKIIFTFICLSGGWRGGAFTPLMVGGGLMASWASSLLLLPVGFATSLGVFSIIALKFDCPVTSVLITGEMFGWKAGLASIPLHALLRFARPQIHFEKIFRQKDKKDHSSSL